mmetsp:Transcript_2475/g.6746  ORF Transcript_2475/g.6746 Transcript_2475/m.6746 type:complete len:81 (-) Transcript_2475:768-1010(-)
MHRRKMFFGFNVFDPVRVLDVLLDGRPLTVPVSQKNSPAINTHQESYASGFTTSALGQKKSAWGGKSAGSKSLAQYELVF